MRIIQVGKFHFPQGGADKYFLDLSRALERRGHDVAHFSMRHPKNEPSEWEDYFVSQVNPTGNLLEKLRAFGRPYYSFEENRLFEKLIRDFHPDIIHVHNICYYLSPSFLSIAKKYGISVIVHLHDYSLISPNYLLYTEKGDYEGGKHGRYFECAKDRCFRSSYLFSFLTALEMYFHHRILGIFDSVAVYVAPSVFMKEEIQIWRRRIRNIEVIPHGTVMKDLPEESSVAVPAYFLFVGRLSPEKGIDVLIRAFSRLSSGTVLLKIVGSGPELGNLQALCRSLHVEDRVEFAGFRTGEELERIIGRSRAVVVPSKWKEVFGLVAIEAMASGKPVIVSDRGGLPEVVGDAGMIVPAGDDEALARAMQMVLDDKEYADMLGAKARKRVGERFLFEKHLDAIENLYREILENKSV
jgi:glycosyltransferase involved in cell wall biosynthesis